MKNQPFIDVIIPSYNGLPYLKEAIDSVLSQTYKNFYLYVVDDGSTDKKATENYVKNINDERVKYFKKPNGGLSSARNYGIEASKSPFIALLDADDIWMPEKLEKQIKYFDEYHDVGMVYGYQKTIDKYDEIIGEVTHCKEGYLFNYLLSGNKVSGSGSMVVIKRSVIEDVGLFRKDFLIGEDWEMWLRIARKYKIGCAKEYLAKIRITPGSLQKNYLKMARGLEYMLPIIVEEFNLRSSQKAKIAGVCLWDATLFYYRGGDAKSAKRTLKKLIKANPLKVKIGFKINVNFEYWFMYMRLFLGNSLIRAIRRKYSASYREREAELNKKFKEQNSNKTA